LQQSQFGIGIDLVKIKRFEKIPYKTRPKFYKKIFTPTEIKYCLRYRHPAKHFAVRFALKEAVKKSIKKNVNFIDIVTGFRSKPVVSIRDDQEHIFLASLSHEDEYAIAVVISIRQIR
jgi:holo-[acyl-carrier protein] synthase